MYDIETRSASPEFSRCWKLAGSHIQRQVQGHINWLKSDLNPPFLEHLSFRLGNQLFFVRIEDVDGKLAGPASRAGLMMIAERCNGHACIMPMKLEQNGWQTVSAGWGLLNAKTGQSVNPILLVSDELIEMTEWELQDFAVQIVKADLVKQGRKLVSSQANPEVNPSVWFVGDDGPEWVVVRSVRYPLKSAPLPADLAVIANNFARVSKKGHFASVSVANGNDSFDPTGATLTLPLWRGHGLSVRFDGLIPLDSKH